MNGTGSTMNQHNDNGRIAMLVLIVLLLGAGVVFVIRILDQDPIEEAMSGDRVINTLFVFEDRDLPLATYVFMYYPRTRKVAIFSIPGEVGRILRTVDRVDRIDTTYSPARIGPYEAEIENLLDLDINFYVVFTMDSLARLVDLLEGVDIFIPRAVAVYGSDPVFFPSGLTRLDGDKARSWLTFTDPDSEDDAPARRQRFFLGLIRRFRARNDIFTSPAFAPVLGAAMKTGMSQRAMSRLFGEFAGIDMDRLSVQTVGGTRREVSGQTLLIPYYEGSQIKEFVRHALSSLTRQSEGAEDERIFTVEVLNGTNIAGLAGRTAELLRGFGYDVISIGNADRSDYETTRVIDHSGFQDVAEEFAGVIRCENIRFESPGGDGAPGGMNMNPQSLEYRADITLVIGRDFNGRYVSGG